MVYELTRYRVYTDASYFEDIKTREGDDIIGLGAYIIEIANGQFCFHSRTWRTTLPCHESTLNELLAIYRALYLLRYWNLPCTVEIYTDCSYAIQHIHLKRRGTKTASIVRKIRRLSEWFPHLEFKVLSKKQKRQAAPRRAHKLAQLAARGTQTTSRKGAA